MKMHMSGQVISLLVIAANVVIRTVTASTVGDHDNSTDLFPGVDRSTTSTTRLPVPIGDTREFSEFPEPNNKPALTSDAFHTSHLTDSLVKLFKKVNIHANDHVKLSSPKFPNGDGSPSLSYDDKAQNTLMQIHVLMRHGQRSPLRGYKGDPYNSERYWNNGFAQLTMEGLKMHDNLGKWLRHRYGSLLTNPPNFFQFQVRSTDLDRTINSAQANLAALFFLKEHAYRYRRDLPYTPVPIHTVPVELDKLLHITDACPEISRLEQAFMNSDKAYSMLKRSEILFDFLTEKLLYNVTTLVDGQLIYDTFKIHEENGLPLPDWMPLLMDNLKQISDFVFDNFAGTDKLKILRGGPLLKKILRDMSDKAHYNSSTNMYMYSGHDVTIAANMQTLGVYNNKEPPYASAIIYELHNDHVTNEHFVKVLYHNDTQLLNGPFYLDIPRCSGNCTLNNLTKSMQDMLPGDNYDALCKLGFSFTTNVIFIIAICMGFIILFVVVYKWCLQGQYAAYRRKKEHYRIGV